MTEQDLTALAKETYWDIHGEVATKLAKGYLTIKAERDALQAKSYDDGYLTGYTAGLDEASGDPRVERVESGFTALQSATNGEYSREDHVVIDALQAAREFAVRLVMREKHISQLVAERDALKAQLEKAIKECEEHNGDYHWRTQDAVLAVWREMVKT